MAQDPNTSLNGFSASDAGNRLGLCAVSLPGLGFSLWTSSYEGGVSPQPANGPVGFGRGFSLPDLTKPAEFGSKLTRGFCKKQGNRVVNRSVPTAFGAEDVSKSETVFSEPEPVVVPKPAFAEPVTSAPRDASKTPLATDAESVIPFVEDPPKTPTKTNTIEPEPLEPHTTVSTHMTPSSLHLPGNGFSVWTQQPPASQAVQLVLNAAVCATSVADAPASVAPSPEPIVSSGSGSGSSSFATHPAPAKPSSGGGGFLKWAALFLFLCALAAFLSSESKRKEIVEVAEGLKVDKANLTVEKQVFHDNLVEEQGKTAKLTEDVGGLETALTASKASITQLTAEKDGLSNTIKELNGSLAMAIQDHKNTEASMQKVIKGLESKNAELTSTLQQEREKLKGLDTRLAEVMTELTQVKGENQKLTDENTGLQEKVSQLQSTLDQTVKDAEQREKDLRDQLDSLKEANETLTSAVSEQQKEVSDIKEKLRVSEEAIAKDKESDKNTQSQLNTLAKQLREAIVARDALNDEKQALASSVTQLSAKLESADPSSASTVALQKRVADLESETAQSDEQVKKLETARADLLQRNASLQTSVEQLNAHLSKLAETEENQENALTGRINELTKTNADLKKSLESQRDEFNTLLRNEAITKPSAAKGAMQDLKKTLGTSIERETAAKESFSNMLIEHTDEMLSLNTEMAKTSNELAAANALLIELDDLRMEVGSLRQQGETLETELAQRATHISTLNQDNSSWQKETEKLRRLLETEQSAQNKLREFALQLQSRIAEIEEPTSTVAKQ
jgi:predicted  nucleic acid-binding Zn-ribbon protein